MEKKINQLHKNRKTEDHRYSPTATIWINILPLHQDLRFSEDEEIYEAMKQMGYVERLTVKRNYKYKNVQTKICLTNDMESIFIKGGSNITNAKFSSNDIKKRYSWHAAGG
ncbi:unnamed protein product [Rhizophagus irregularis]|nr:unnamed protein product [Rhizophagus irregularis]